MAVAASILRGLASLLTLEQATLDYEKKCRDESKWSRLNRLYTRKNYASSSRGRSKGGSNTAVVASRRPKSTQNSLLIIPAVSKRILPKALQTKAPTTNNQIRKKQAGPEGAVNRQYHSAQQAISLRGRDFQFMIDPHVTGRIIIMGLI